MSELNVPNRTIFCKDNLPVLRGINDSCIDLIYLDPPFNKNKVFSAPLGSSAEGTSFKDIFREEDLKEEWLQEIAEERPDLFHFLTAIKLVGKPYNFAYLAYMTIRLLECFRILKDTGSLYLHCDLTMSHYIKLMLDCIFGENNFRNELVWCYKDGANSKSQYNKKHDNLLFYSKGHDYTFNYEAILRPLAESTVKKYRHQDSKGKYRLMGRGIVSSPIKSKRDVSPKWEQMNPELVYRHYMKKGALPLDWLEMPPINQNSKERTKYPTQKPLALLDHIIRASSNAGDTVLDPFCGCATTCIAAEKQSRCWIGIDISIKAYELVQDRLRHEVDHPQKDFTKDRTQVNLRTDPPKRTDQGMDYQEKKFVYVISHPKYPGEYKVGIAKDWQSRLNSYQTSDPDRQYKIEFYTEKPNFRETEKYIHAQFQNKHEWVQGNLPEIITAIKEH
ncbi:MAG: GIY-YIG nuclease family protein [Cellvibrionales bacterium]|nr:GIY-YIG nuclease family protein [Cellvibrionales bacterium]